MTTIRRFFLIISLLLLLPISAFALNQGDPLKAFSATDMDGKSVDLASVIGNKPIMLVFWASWCPNCRSEVPKVNALRKKFQQQGMQFLGVNVGHNDSVAKARRFMDKYQMSYPVVFDKDSAISHEYAIQGVPTVLVANKQGIIVFKNYGVPEITDKDFAQLNK